MFDDVDKILKLQAVIKHHQLYSVTWAVIGNMLQHVKQNPTQINLLQQLCEAFYNHCKTQNSTLSWNEPDASKIWSECHQFLQQQGRFIEHFESPYFSDWMRTVSYLINYHEGKLADPILTLTKSEMTLDLLESNELCEPYCRRNSN